MKPSEQPAPRYRPLNARRRWLLGGLAVATACAVVATLLSPPGGVKRVRHLPADTPACAAGQDSGCAGGKAEVIVVAPVAGASGARP